MVIYSLLVLLSFLITSCRAILWSVSLLNGNYFDSVAYTITVPEAPPAEVLVGEADGESGLWAFGCGFQSPGGSAAIAPYIELGEITDGTYLDENTVNASYSFVFYNLANNGSTKEWSDALWVGEGDTLQVNVTADETKGYWHEHVTVSSGASAGANVTQIFPFASGGMNLFSSVDSSLLVCRAELYGNMTDYWNFAVQISNLTVHAKASEGVLSKCQQFGTTWDITGYAAVGNLTGGDNYCSWDNITLLPPLGNIIQALSPVNVTS